MGEEKGTEIVNRSVPLLVICFLVVSCSLVPIDRSDLIGTYIANYPGSVDILTLRDDSTFTQYYLGYHDTLPFMWIDTGIWHWSGYGIGTDGMFDGYINTSIKASELDFGFAREDWSGQVKLLIEVEPSEYAYRMVDGVENPKAIFDSLSHQFRSEHRIVDSIPTYNHEYSPDLR